MGTYIVVFFQLLVIVNRDSLAATKTGSRESESTESGQELELLTVWVGAELRDEVVVGGDGLDDGGVAGELLDELGVAGDGVDHAGVAHDARGEVGVGRQGVDDFGVVGDGLDDVEVS